MNPVLVVAVLLVALAGCKPRAAADTPSAQVNAAAPAESPAPAPATESQPAPALPAGPVAMDDGGDSDATLDRLTEALQSYISTTHFRPKSFPDFVARAHVQVPPPPPGKDYAIVRGTVALVNH